MGKISKPETVSAQAPRARPSPVGLPPVAEPPFPQTWDGSRENRQEKEKRPRNGGLPETVPQTAPHGSSAARDQSTSKTHKRCRIIADENSSSTHQAPKKRPSGFELPPVAEPPFPTTSDGSRENNQEDEKRLRYRSSSLRAGDEKIAEAAGIGIHESPETTARPVEQQAALRRSPETTSRSVEQRVGAVHSYPTTTHDETHGGTRVEDENSTSNEGMFPPQVVISNATAVACDPYEGTDEEYPTAEVVPEYNGIKVPLGCCVMHFPAKACSTKALLAYALILLAIIIAATITGVSQNSGKREHGTFSPSTFPSSLTPTKAPTLAPREGEDAFQTLPSPLVTPSPTDACSDSHEHCSPRASSGGCKSSPDHMLTACQKSCGVCGGSFFELRSQLNDKYCLAVHSSTADDFTPMWLQECDGTPGQLFRVGADRRLRSQLSPNACVEMDPDHGIFMHSACYDTWTILPAVASGDRGIDGRVILRNDWDDLCVAADLGVYQPEITSGTLVTRGNCTDNPSSDFLLTTVEY